MPIVKRFTTHVPDESGEFERTKCKVFLDPKTSGFEVEIPEHIGAVVRGMGLPDWMQIWGHEPAGEHQFRLVSKTVEDAVSSFDFLCRKYKEWLQDQAAEPYLKVIFKFNVQHVNGFHDAEDAPGFREFASYNGGRPHKMHFATTPALELRTEKVWKIGADFFNASRRATYKWALDQDLRSGARGGIYCIRWTQEREDFLSKMDHAMTSLICQLMVFFEDMEGHMDFAIETGASPLALPSA